MDRPPTAGVIGRGKTSSDRHGKEGASVPPNVSEPERDVGTDLSDGSGEPPTGDPNGDGSGRGAAGEEPDRGEGAPDLSELAAEVGDLRETIEELNDRTVEKPTLEAELKRYVRRRMRRGRARGWGPYLVLLYGTVMVVAAFRFLDGWFAIGAMIVLFLSTLGLYTLFVLVGAGLNLLEYPGRAIDAVRRWR